MQQSIVRKSARSFALPLTPMMACRIWLARPVIVRQPATMPATQQATPTEMHPCVPPAKASKNFFGVMRVSLENMLTTIAATVATAAANAIVRLPDETRYTRITSGSSRYVFFRSGFTGGSSLRGTPCSPDFFASRCTQMKMPVKYSTAGRIARTTMFEYGRLT